MHANSTMVWTLYNIMSLFNGYILVNLIVFNMNCSSWEVFIISVYILSITEVYIQYSISITMQSVLGYC